MESQGYRRHVRMVWCKENGPPGNYTVRWTHEYLLWYYKPKFMPISVDTKGRYPSAFHGKPKGRVHSRKPDEAYEIIENMYPYHLGVRKMDVFSRETRPHYDCWGNQTGLLDDVK